MDENTLEGSLVLERLAEIHKLDEFYGAIDSDHFSLAKALMQQAGVDSDSIEVIMKEIMDTDWER